MKVKSGFVPSGNAELYYEIAGEGRPVAFIHAGVADSRQWNNEFADFASEFRVLRYDMRGYGRSAPADGEFSHIEDLTALLDQLELRQQVVLVGCSMGGTLAMDFALASPSRVRALVMVGSGPSGLTLDVPDHPMQANAAEAYKSGDVDLLAELEAQIWFDGMGRTAEQVDQKMRQLAIDMNQLALTHEAKGLGNRRADAESPAANRLEQIQIPVLIIVGEYDIPYTHAAADYMLDNLPPARKVLIEDAAHLANMDHPHEFQSAVRGFLRELVT